ncbi:MAG: hypothetical protein KatS3mg112_0241 [Thermogutta sp.]|nr:MAG: hypothetical protein KatS3mg112_0241 [Thermogutta sp.]
MFPLPQTPGPPSLTARAIRGHQPPPLYHAAAGCPIIKISHRDFRPIDADVEGSALNALDTVIQIWWFVIGAVVGSFLNVVIHRLPRGESLVWPGSHCPHCGHPIRWFDNLPILSWLILRGRCRDCGAPISVRYPLVEAISSVIVGSTAQVVSTGHWGQWLGGIAVMDHAATAVLLQVLSLAAFLLTVFVAAAISWDGQPVPLVVWTPCTGITVLAYGLMPLWPVEHHVPILSDSSSRACVLGRFDRRDRSRMGGGHCEPSSGEAAQSRRPARCSFMGLELRHRDGSPRLACTGGDYFGSCGARFTGLGIFAEISREPKKGFFGNRASTAPSGGHFWLSGGWPTGAFYFSYRRQALGRLGLPEQPE